MPGKGGSGLPFPAKSSVRLNFSRHGKVHKIFSGLVNNL